MAPHCAHLRNGVKMGNFEMVDTMIKDGLWDAFNGYHMGNTAENVAQQWQITRAAAGRVRGRARRTRPRRRRRPASSRTRSCRSRSRRARATSSSTPTSIRKHGVTLDAMAKLRPAFDKDGTVTAGNASGINDGAAAVVLMKASEAAQARARSRSRASSPGRMPASIRRSWAPGPIPASRAALKKAGWKIDDLDLIEANEAFAAQACAVNKDLGWDTEQGQRQWRRDRDRPSDRRLGRARAGDAAARDAEAQRQEGPRHAVHRRRHGHRDVRGAVSTRRLQRRRARTGPGIIRKTFVATSRSPSSPAMTDRGGSHVTRRSGHRRNARHRRRDLPRR